MLDPALVVRAYREGLFPMAIEGGEIGWFSPERRGVLPLEDFHVPARLTRTLRRQPFVRRSRPALQCQTARTFLRRICQPLLTAGSLTRWVTGRDGKIRRRQR